MDTDSTEDRMLDQKLDELLARTHESALKHLSETPYVRARLQELLRTVNIVHPDHPDQTVE